MSSKLERPQLKLNISVPQAASQAAELAADGVGLMRAEFMALQGGRHPAAILEDDGAEAYREFFREGLAQVAGAFHPRPVTYRACDLKSNEYRSLAGGEKHEPVESNPMIGRRGAYRYLQHPEELMLELDAVAQVRAAGLDRVELMIPFVRTVPELLEVRRLVERAGLLGQEGFRLWAMAEVPSVALLPERFAAEVDGLSIGTNDLVQLVLGVDRDSAELSRHYGIGDPAVLEAIGRIVEGAHRAGRPVSVCGDQPAVEASVIEFLVEQGVDSISVVASAFESVSAHLDELCGAS